MTKKLILIVLLVSAVGMFINCQGNIFGWVYPGADAASEDVTGLISRGETALRSGDINGALIYFKTAMDKNPRSSEARWGYARAYILYKNVDFLYLTSKIVGDMENSAGAFSELCTVYDLKGTLTVIIDTLDNPTYSIVKNQCDGIIPYNDFAVNFDLMFCYFIRALAKIGDSNNDKQFFTATPTGGDFLVFGDKNFLVENTNVIRNEQNRKLFDNTIRVATNNYFTSTSTAKSYYVNLLHALHELIEDIIYVYYLADTGLYDFSNFYMAFLRGVQGIIGDNKTVQDMINISKKQNDVFALLVDNAVPDTSILKTDHNDIVGKAVFTTTYKDYQRDISSWANDYAAPGGGSLAAQLMAAPDPLNPGGPEGTLMLSIITKATQVIRHVNNLKLLETLNPSF